MSIFLRNVLNCVPVGGRLGLGGVLLPLGVVGAHVLLEEGEVALPRLHLQPRDLGARELRRPHPRALQRLLLLPPLLLLLGRDSIDIMGTSPILSLVI